MDSRSHPIPLQDRPGAAEVTVSSEKQGSVTHWIGDLKAGDVAAAQPLWERYFARLVQLARAKLRATRRPPGIEDEEDAALSAFNSFCAGAAKGHFPLLSDRDDLWRLLVVITARKACAQVQRRTRQKRGGGRVLDEAALPGAGGLAKDEAAAGFDFVAGPEPTPEFAAMFAEEYERLLNALDDDSLRQVALDRMEGYTNDEIAERLGCARRTVARRLDLIRKIWSEEEESE
ncbi:ECF-type sigma factor [Singulisphaera acidiphila]|uniref:ECF-type sigma factor n=1 Tax=Singulisphaera acidiphila TaxID=466153 RepID=UPI00035EE868|nr:ECF-type sigma factor [Singulisphaera acidiphila]